MATYRLNKWPSNDDSFSNEDHRSIIPSGLKPVVPSPVVPSPVVPSPAVPSGSELNPLEPDMDVLSSLNIYHDLLHGKLTKKPRYQSLPMPSFHFTNHKWTDPANEQAMEHVEMYNTDAAMEPGQRKQDAQDKDYVEPSGCCSKH
ncbi:hypothetical protein EVJ58_g952 [Rhodofomes roseus]|uniref:Uncharacterized protein n=1 Tax=Rhodofomes roseus TaxID=34475 RepID=A0A4Y9Z1T1_9APHY|nr:hypothetical protein EVJ58_g952 [Rhodofomes roseus]